jgi:hypothetical protein
VRLLGKRAHGSELRKQWNRARKQWNRARKQWNRARKQRTRVRKQWIRARKAADSRAEQWIRARKQWNRARKQRTRAHIHWIYIDLPEIRPPARRTCAPHPRADAPDHATRLAFLIIPAGIPHACAPVPEKQTVQVRTSLTVCIEAPWPKRFDARVVDSGSRNASACRKLGQCPCAERHTGSKGADHSWPRAFSRGASGPSVHRGLAWA